MDGHQFKFGWPLEHFAKVNGLAAGDAATKQAYQKTRSAAEADMKAIAASIMKGSVRQRSIYFKGGIRVSLGLGVEWEASGLRCDEIK
jgi:hypothetical protein